MELPHIISSFINFEIQFLVEIVNSSRVYSERSQTSKMELFEKKIFSHPLFRPFAIYTKSAILDVRFRFRKRLNLNAWQNWKTCKWVIFRNVAAKTKKWFLRNFWENSTEKWFSSQLLSASFGVLRKLSLKILQYSRKTPVLESPFIKSLYFIKKTPTQVFSCVYCEIFKNTYFEKHLRKAASVNSVEFCFIF